MPTRLRKHTLYRQDQWPIEKRAREMSQRHKQKTGDNLQNKKKGERTHVGTMNQSSRKITLNTNDRLSLAVYH